MDALTIASLGGLANSGLFSSITCIKVSENMNIGTYKLLFLYLVDTFVSIAPGSSYSYTVSYYYDSRQYTAVITLTISSSYVITSSTTDSKATFNYAQGIVFR